MTTYYFDSRGKWIAFRTSPTDAYLYDKKGKWVGWFPWNDEDAVDTHGRYLGTLVGDRLLRKAHAPHRGYPGFAGGVGLPAGYSDLGEIFEGGTGPRLTLTVDGSWSGWSGDTVVQMTDGSVWKQAEYHYEYHYAYRPTATIFNGKLQVDGMSKAVNVRRL